MPRQARVPIVKPVTRFMSSRSYLTVAAPARLQLNSPSVVARRGHPLQKADSLAQLTEANWVSLLPLDAPGGPFDRAFSPVGLSIPQRVIQCESYNTAIGLIAKTDMLGFLSRQLLAASILGDFLQEIPVAESLPSLIVGMFTRTDTPLTQVAGAMAKAVTAAARELARSA